MNKKRILTFLGFGVVLAGTITSVAYINLRDSPQINDGWHCDIAPVGAPCYEIKTLKNPVYKSGANYILNETGYECSQSIKLASYTINRSSERINFEPVNQAEATKYCKVSFVI